MIKYTVPTGIISSRKIFVFDDVSRRILEKGSVEVFQCRTQKTCHEDDGDDGDDDDDDNNNNIYLLQLGCYPVAVVILHVNKHEISYY